MASSTSTNCSIWWRTVRTSTSLRQTDSTSAQNPSIAKALSRYKRVHVRVSIKGSSEQEFHRLTGAGTEFYELAYQAMEHLIAAGVSCNACLMASFSDVAGIKAVKQRLSDIAPGILNSLEIERINQFPKVRKRLSQYGLKANQGVSMW